MKIDNKNLALCLALICSIFIMPASSFASNDSGAVADSGDPDFFIPDCTQDPNEREALCDQIYGVDSSDYDDSSDIIPTGDPQLASVCATFFNDPANAGKKMIICHKQKNTLRIASEGACNGHLPQHADDSFGPCLNGSGDPLEYTNCVADSSSQFVTAEDYAADSGLAGAVDDCPDTVPVEPAGSLVGAKPGRMNVFEEIE